MADEPKKQAAVRWEVGAELGMMWLKLTADGVPPVQISVDPQAGFEMGEAMARAAHTARYGKPPPDGDMSYLHQQVKARVTEQLETMLANRITVMLNTMREDRQWSNQRLAKELIGRVLDKVT